MPNIPFEKQILAPDYLTSVRMDAKSGNPVSGTDLLRAIEQSIERTLPDAVRSLVRAATIPAVKKPGRPGNFGASLDFALRTLDRRHPLLLRKYQDEARKRREAAEPAGTKLPKAEQSPSERAYRRILATMKMDFGNIDWKALRNLHSRWKKGNLHSAEMDVDSEDFDAEIERKFPAPKRRS